MVRLWRPAVDGPLPSKAGLLASGNQGGQASGGIATNVMAAAQHTAGMTIIAPGVLRLSADTLGLEVGTMGSVVTMADHRTCAGHKRWHAESIRLGQTRSAGTVVMRIDGMATGVQARLWFTTQVSQDALATNRTSSGTCDRLLTSQSDAVSCRHASAPPWCAD